jgi:hypothetical protein
MLARIEINLEAIMKFIKSLLVALPFLLQIALFSVLYTHRNSIVAASPRYTEHIDICDLHRQRDRIAAQLAILEHKPKQFLPRGVPPAPSDPAHANPRNN